MRLQVCLFLVTLIASSPGNSPRGTDQQEIDDLVRSFSSTMAQAGDPSPFLSPNHGGQPRSREIDIARKHYTAFNLTGFSVDRDLTFQDAEHASLKVWLSWQTPHLSTEKEATIHFEKVAGAWYFNDFDFLRFNWALTILMSLSGVFYAATVLSFYSHWRKQTLARGSRKYAWLILVLTPIGWILYPIVKPWRLSPPTAAGSPG